MSPRRRVIFSRISESNILPRHSTNSVCGDVASYLKRNETSQSPLREYTQLHISRHLKMRNLPLRLKR